MLTNVDISSYIGFTELAGFSVVFPQQAARHPICTTCTKLVQKLYSLEAYKIQTNIRQKNKAVRKRRESNKLRTNYEQKRAICSLQQRKVDAMIDWDNPELSEHDPVHPRGKFSMGTTSFLCKNCKSVTVVENLDLEKMTEFRCPGCGFPMTTTSFAKVKMLYYGTLYAKLADLGGEGPPVIATNICIHHHYEDNKE